MLLPEYKGKALLRQVGLTVLSGTVVRSADEVRAISDDLQFPVAVKAQVASGGRGKKGGVLRVQSGRELADAVASVMAMEFDGETPEAVLIEPWVQIERELYLAVVVDPAAEGYSVLYSAQGGVEVESGAGPVQYSFGVPWKFRSHHLREHLASVETDGKLTEAVAAVAHRLLKLATARDLTTVEINPLAVLEKGRLAALDAKIVIDEWAADRNSDIRDAIMESRSREPQLVQDSLNMNHMYVALDGDIGVLSGGAGMTMCAMDMVDQFGGRPACFLDCSPGPTSARGYQPAFAMLDADPRIKAILVSIYGGGTQMQRVANAMKAVLAERTSDKPVVFRLNGTNVDQANEILEGIGVRNHAALETAVQEVVQLAEARP